MPGRTLVVLAEQGLGDTVQFIRYLAQVKQRVGKVVFNCPGPLVKLVSSVAGIDHIVAVDSGAAAVRRLCTLGKPARHLPNHARHCSCSHSVFAGRSRPDRSLAT